MKSGPETAVWPSGEEEKEKEKILYPHPLGLVPYRPLLCSKIDVRSMQEKWCVRLFMFSWGKKLDVLPSMLKIDKGEVDEKG